MLTTFAPFLSIDAFEFHQFQKMLLDGLIARLGLKLIQLDELRAKLVGQPISYLYVESFRLLYPTF